jgi:hypothetical protein
MYFLGCFSHWWPGLALCCLVAPKVRCKGMALPTHILSHVIAPVPAGLQFSSRLIPPTDDGLESDTMKAASLAEDAQLYMAMVGLMLYSLLKLNKQNLKNGHGPDKPSCKNKLSLLCLTRGG